jgi:transposase
VTFTITPGNSHDSPQLPQLMQQGAIRRPSGQRRTRPRRVVCDKGYTGRPNRSYLRRRGIRYTIPRLSTERRRGPFDRAIYRQRNIVERLINRLKQNRRVATRYEKRAHNFLAMVILASIRLWLAI